MFSEKSLQILWQKPSDPYFMKTRRNRCNRFFRVLSLMVLALVEWPVRGQERGLAAPGVESQGNDPQGVVAQAEDRPAGPAGGRPRTAAAELKRARDLLTRHSTIRRTNCRAGHARRPQLPG